MEAHLLGRVAALGTLLGGIGALVLGVASARASIIVGHGTVQGVPASGSGSIGIGITASVMLVLAVGAAVWAIASDRRLVTTNEDLGTPIPLRGARASETTEKTRKAA
jgi:hypothetical protein